MRPDDLFAARHIFTGPAAKVSQSCFKEVCSLMPNIDVRHSHDAHAQPSISSKKKKNRINFFFQDTLSLQASVLLAPK